MTDVELPPFTLGTAMFGGLGSLPALLGRGDSRATAFELMDAAWDAGLTWFDTADAYGGGVSEQWIGDWIRETGHRPQVTTKTFNPMAPDAGSGLSRERILRQVSGSLRRLGTDRIDVYLAHEFDDATPIAETMATLDELRAQGVIAAYGVSNFSAPQLRAALEAGSPAVVQNSFSLLNRRDELDVIPLCVEHGLAYQAYSPLAGGWLSGKYRPDQQPPGDSRLALAPQWYLHIDSRRAFEALAMMADIARAERLSQAGLALAWVHAHPHVSGMVIGPRSVEHFEPATEAAAARLHAHSIKQLSSIFDSAEGECR